jgi:hypothetical protein
VDLHLHTCIVLDKHVDLHLHTCIVLDKHVDLHLHTCIVLDKLVDLHLHTGTYRKMAVTMVETKIIVSITSPLRWAVILVIMLRSSKLMFHCFYRNVIMYLTSYWLDNFQYQSKFADTDNITWWVQKEKCPVYIRVEILCGCGQQGW